MYFIYSISHILCFVYACLILFLYICFRFHASSADLTTKKKMYLDTCISHILCCVLFV